MTETKVTQNELGTDTVGAWTSWTPSWANLTIGNATVIGKYMQIGKTVIFRLYVVLGNSSSVGTSPTFTLPVAANSNMVFASDPMYIGTTEFVDVGTVNMMGITKLASATTGLLLAMTSAGAYTTSAGVTASVPFTWTTNDIISVVGTYEAA